MKMDIRFHGLELSPALRDHARNRLASRLRRFGREVSEVTVRIGDVNGPRGGVDKRCRIVVRGPRFGPWTLEELHTDPYGAVDAATGRLAQAVARAISRARDAELGDETIRTPFTASRSPQLPHQRLRPELQRFAGPRSRSIRSA
jgi:putative sigma-54 modulation protein